MMPTTVPNAGNSPAIASGQMLPFGKCGVSTCKITSGTTALIRILGTILRIVLRKFIVFVVVEALFNGLVVMVYIFKTFLMVFIFQTSFCWNRSLSFWEKHTSR